MIQMGEDFLPPYTSSVKGQPRQSSDEPDPASFLNDVNLGSPRTGKDMTRNHRSVVQGDKFDAVSTSSLESGTGMWRHNGILNQDVDALRKAISKMELGKNGGHQQKLQRNTSAGNTPGRRAARDKPELTKGKISPDGNGTGSMYVYWPTENEMVERVSEDEIDENVGMDRAVGSWEKNGERQMVEHRVLEDGPVRTVTIWRESTAKCPGLDKETATLLFDAKAGRDER
jgi:hypothetical protein